jgi:hypothetical protein
MTATARVAFQMVRTGNLNRPSPLAVLIARAEARAILWQACTFDLHTAIDVLWHAAERDGLVAALGADRVQQLLGDSFSEVR